MPGEDKRPPKEDLAPSCQVTFLVDDRQGHGTSRHFHDQGMLVICEEPAELHKRLSLTLEFPSIPHPIQLQGDVVWTNIHGRDDSLSPRGMGVKFVNLDRDEERLLAELAREFAAKKEIYSCYYT